MPFTQESDFENALINTLKKKGWEEQIIEYPTEKDLIQNWASILFENNKEIDRLNNIPLTDSEMAQILEKIAELKTPLKLNGLINGKTISVTRDNPKDTLHLGHEVSLKIYDRNEIAAGQSRYQIVRQPKLKAKSALLNNRRGDLMLLINGMPLFHIELKRSNVSVTQACCQTEKYAYESVFTGLFSLVQVFVAMEPNETVYFANPGPDGKFNSDYYFHWADFNNERINNWEKIASSLLSIPMAHQLIGFYTVADGSDGVLKVMRSYQYYAANAISDTVSKIKWGSHSILGGFIWHTTGSGKTMTSFKSAELIANSGDADKVIFLMDRIELGTQSLKEYRNFANENEEIQGTENTNILITKLKSDNYHNTLIVTSIQKMSNIKNGEDGLNAYDISIMNSKRIVFIVDEAHRSTFGDMLITIKQTFPNAIFFGFTGTPIKKENQKKMNTTSTVFGNELHRYSIADGIRDKNVLGFDPYKILTYKDKDLRKAVALDKSKSETKEEALADPKKSEVFNKFMDSSKVKMAGFVGDDGKDVKGIEDYISNSQYRRKEHQQQVINDILGDYVRLSNKGMFHSIFATSSIDEAIEYYRLIKKQKPELKITALFDPNIDNNDGFALKEDGLIEIISDYNQRYGVDFSLATHAQFKKDIAARLSHKEPYILIERTPEKELDLLIVVGQMLTGFDSKWINTLYLDKVLEYENIIQAFSRTNRLFGEKKPFGIIKYYRRPHTMERNIQEAVKLYSGDKPIGMFVERLSFNIKKMNEVFADISDLFSKAGSGDFTKLPEDKSERGKFAKAFKQLNEYLESARVQGFTWDKLQYEVTENKGEEEQTTSVSLNLDENTYLAMALRYKELFSGKDSDSEGSEDVPYEIEGYLTEIDTDKIDVDYMNSRFTKYLKILSQENVTEEQLEQGLNDLHKSFAFLTQEEQKYANIFIHDVQMGNVEVDSNISFWEYVSLYQHNAENEQVSRLCSALGLDEKKLRSMMNCYLTENNINEFGRFDELKSSVNKEKAYFEKIEGNPVSPFVVNIKIQTLLQKFLLSGGIEIEK